MPGIYFALTGCFLLQNTFQFWPVASANGEKARAQNIEEHKKRIDRLKTSALELALSLPNADTTKRKAIQNSLRSIKQQIRTDSMFLTSFENIRQASDNQSSRAVWYFFMAGKTFLIDGEKLLFILVLLMGALGSWLHAATSYLIFVGIRSFVTSWMMWYLMRPIVGGVLALLFYVVIRAGFLPYNASAAGVQTIDLLNPFSRAQPN